MSKIIYIIRAEYGDYDFQYVKLLKAFNNKEQAEVHLREYLKFYPYVKENSGTYFSSVDLNSNTYSLYKACVYELNKISPVFFKSVDLPWLSIEEVEYIENE